MQPLQVHELLRTWCRISGHQLTEEEHNSLVDLISDHSEFEIRALKLTVANTAIDLIQKVKYHPVQKVPDETW